MKRHVFDYAAPQPVFSKSLSFTVSQIHTVLCID